MSARGHSEQLIEQMRVEAKSKDREILKMDEEKARLKQTIIQKESLVDKYRSEDVGVPVNMWIEERRLLQVRLISLIKIETVK